MTDADESDPIALLAGFPLLSTLPPATLALLAARLRAVDVRCGEALIRQGEPGKSLFLVVDGRFEARAEEPGGRRVLGVVGRGETVGEMAVIAAEPRHATVIATRRSSVLELSGEDFLRVFERQPAELLALTRQIVLRSTRPAASSPVRRVALLPLDEGVDIAWLAQALEEALSGFGTTLRLGRSLAMAQVGKGAADGTVPQLSPSFLAWLADNERAHEFVVYEAMYAVGEWTRRCLSQADLVLLVGRAGGSPDLTAIEQIMLGADSIVTLAPQHLVLLRKDRGSDAQGTARWLDPRSVALHHYVAIGDRGDVARLARSVAGRSVQLVLSGGGVRGAAHIGVMRALEEASVPVDFVGGVSIGAIVAAFRAMEWDATQMQRAVKRIASLKDPTFPFVSLFAARRGAREAEALCEGRHIEDLPIGYFGVSADLCGAEEVVHRRGPLWMAMRASASVPGVFPPMLVGDQCLVDGGVLNNLPIDVMSRLAPGRLVAVDVSREVALDLASARMLGAAGTSGFRLLFWRLNPFRKSGPRILHIGDVLTRAAEMAAVRIGRSIRERTSVTLRIEPPVEGYRMLDFASTDAIIEAGYEYAAANVEEWKRQLLA